MYYRILLYYRILILCVKWLMQDIVVMQDNCRRLKILEHFCGDHHVKHFGITFFKVPTFQELTDEMNVIVSVIFYVVM